MKVSENTKGGSVVGLPLQEKFKTEKKD